MQTSKQRQPSTLLWTLLLVSIIALLYAGCSQPAIKSVSRTTPTPTIASITMTPTAQSFPDAAQIDAYLTHLNQRGVLSGSVLVAQNGMLFEKGYGLADRGANIPN